MGKTRPKHRLPRSFLLRSHGRRTQLYTRSFATVTPKNPSRRRGGWTPSRSKNKEINNKHAVTVLTPAGGEEGGEDRRRRSPSTAIVSSQTSLRNPFPARKLAWKTSLFPFSYYNMPCICTSFGTKWYWMKGRKRVITTIREIRWSLWQFERGDGYNITHTGGYRESRVTSSAGSLVTEVRVTNIPEVTRVQPFLSQTYGQIHTHTHKCLRFKGLFSRLETEDVKWRKEKEKFSYLHKEP